MNFTNCCVWRHCLKSTVTKQLKRGKRGENREKERGFPKRKRETLTKQVRMNEGQRKRQSRLRKLPSAHRGTVSHSQTSNTSISKRLGERRGGRENSPDSPSDPGWMILMNMCPLFSLRQPSPPHQSICAHTPSPTPTPTVNWLGNSTCPSPWLLGKERRG